MTYRIGEFERAIEAEAEMSESVSDVPACRMWELVASALEDEDFDVRGRYELQDLMVDALRGQAPSDEQWASACRRWLSQVRDSVLPYVHHALEEAIAARLAWPADNLERKREEAAHARERVPAFLRWPT